MLQVWRIKRGSDDLRWEFIKENKNVKKNIFSTKKATKKIRKNVYGQEKKENTLSTKKKRKKTRS